MYKYNKQVKNRAILVLWAILGLSVGLYMGMRLFMWGFERGSL